MQNDATKTIIKNVKFDYYNIYPSYLKMILEVLPYDEVLEEAVTRAIRIYNKFLNSATREEIMDTVYISQAVGAKLSTMSAIEVLNFARRVYRYSISEIVQYNEEKECIWFDKLKDSMKMFGYDYYDASESEISLVASGKEGTK